MNEIADILTRMFRFDIVKELYAKHLITEENYQKLLISLASIEMDLDFDDGGEKDV